MNLLLTVPSRPLILTEKLAQKGILGGLPLPDGGLLWCVTEMNTREEIDDLISAIKEAAFE